MKIAEITRHVAPAFDTTPAAIKGRSMARNVVLARHCAMYLSRKQPGNSLPKIGREFGRHHTTVLQAITEFPEKVEQYGYASQVSLAAAAIMDAQQ